MAKQKIQVGKIVAWLGSEEGAAFRHSSVVDSDGNPRSVTPGDLRSEAVLDAARAAYLGEKVSDSNRNRTRAVVVSVAASGRVLFLDSCENRKTEKEGLDDAAHLEGLLSESEYSVHTFAGLSPEDHDSMMEMLGCIASAQVAPAQESSDSEEV